MTVTSVNKKVPGQQILDPEVQDTHLLFLGNHHGTSKKNQKQTSLVQHPCFLDF